MNPEPEEIGKSVSPGHTTKSLWSLLRLTLNAAVLTAFTCLLPTTAEALDFGLWQRLGSTGLNLDLEMSPTGRGHLVYRRGTEIWYRHFDGLEWGPEILLNSPETPGSTRKLDQNQPRISLAVLGGAWVVWASNPPTDVAYVRQISAVGALLSEVQSVALPGNVEDLSIRYWPAGGELHLLALLLDSGRSSESEHEDSRGGFIAGAYDLLLSPADLSISATVRLAPESTDAIQKNLDSLAGPKFLHETGRFHNAAYGRYDGEDWQVDFLNFTDVNGAIGASQMALVDEDEIHLATSSFDLDAELRDLRYTRFQPSTHKILETVPLDASFDSALGIAGIEVTNSERAFVVWDRLDDSETVEVVYSFRDEASGEFSNPRPIPDRGLELASGEHPATGVIGQKVHLVFNDPVDGSLWAGSADFDLETPPTPTPTITPTPSVTPTPTVPPSPSPTLTPTPSPTPRLLDPGMSDTSVHTVEANDDALRVDYRSYESARGKDCHPTLVLWNPLEERFGELELAPELRRVRILDPSPGVWSLEVTQSIDCEEALAYYLNFSSAPLAGEPRSWGTATTVMWLILLLLGMRSNRWSGVDIQTKNQDRIASSPRVLGEN